MLAKQIKPKHQLLLAVSTFLLAVNVATAQQTTTSPQSTQTPRLSAPQREEVRKLIRDEVENSGVIRDRVQTDVGRAFDRIHDDDRFKQLVEV